MGLRARLAGLAKTGEVPIFVVAGGGGRSALRHLRITKGISVVASPRQAAVLLIVGSLTKSATESVSHVHDQMAGPRITVGWGHPEPAVIPLATNVDGEISEVVAEIRQLFGDVLRGDTPAEAPLLPNVDPVEWRGVGPYGHGGAGMTGGTPYGRPLALRAPDEDGLELDQLPVTIGPWFVGFPPGLALRVSLQGDVAQAVEVISDTFVSAGPPDVFSRALHQPTPIRDLEMARARHHLGWMADSLVVSGVDRLARSFVRAVDAIQPGDVDLIRQLTAAVRRSLLEPMALRGVGVLPSDLDLSGLGPVARAAGLSSDQRTLERPYLDLDFRPVTQSDGDAWSRFEQRAQEAAQAVDLAGRAGDLVAFGDGSVEAPEGTFTVGSGHPTDRFLSMLTSVLAGSEWGDLVTTVQSLDINMEFASARDVAS